MIAGSSINRESQRFDGEPYLKVCTDVCAYWTGPPFDRREAILHFFAASMNVVGARLKWYETETLGTRRPLTPDTLKLIDLWLYDERSRRQFMTLELEGGEDPELPSDAAFTFKSIESEAIHAGACRLVVPIYVGLAESDRLLALAKDLFSVSGFTYGTTGFAVHWNPRSNVAAQAKEKFPYLAKRYWGIDIPHLTATLLTVDRGIKSINWLTMLSHDLWELLQSQSPSPVIIENAVRIHPQPGGIIIQAGPQPLLGDRYSDEAIDDYVTVGQALRPVRCDDHPPIIQGPDEDTSISRTEEWLSRFDGER